MENQRFQRQLEFSAGRRSQCNILLQPRDRLLIHRNVDAMSRRVPTFKETWEKPGRYPLTTNMTVQDLIRVGGGLKASADTETADLTKYNGGKRDS